MTGDDGYIDFTSRDGRLVSFTAHFIRLAEHSRHRIDAWDSPDDRFMWGHGFIWPFNSIEDHEGILTIEWITRDFYFHLSEIAELAWSFCNECTVEHRVCHKDMSR
jgi:hypothetical protein